MAFDFVLMLKRLFVVLGIIAGFAAWLILSIVLGQSEYVGPVWAFVIYLSPAVIALLYLMGLE